MREWQTCGAVQHPEVGQGGQSVGADLYLGYGPLVYEKGRTVLGTVRDTGVKRTAIEPAKAFAILRLGYPVECEDELTQTLQLVSCFGTFGSRSRNGWGSLHIEGGGITTLSRQLLNGYLRPLIKCLQVDWPHAIGSDNKGPLVWITAPKNDWREVMKELAGIKIAFRTQPQLLSLEGKHDGDLSGRHVLAYPVTNHAVLGPINKKENEAGWVDVDTRTGKPKTDKRGKFIQSARLANQVRLKVAKHANGQFVGIIVHVPCKLPGVLVNKFEPKNAAFIRDNELRVWQQVHAVLDNSTNRLSRL